MRNLFILPFDHRASFAKTLLGFDYPTNWLEARRVKHMKSIVFDAFLLARKQVEDKRSLAILVDEEFGTAILKKARRVKIAFALTVEKSGQELFDFEYGDAWQRHLLHWRPTFAKVLVRYNPAQSAKNKTQLARLKKLSQFCKKEKMGFMLELLVEGKGEQSALMKRSMTQMMKDGIAPTVWKLEGLPSAKAWSDIQSIAQAPIIVLGRGESKKSVQNWLKAASSAGLHGFAVGRTVFFKPLEDYRDKKISRQEAVNRIAKNYLDFIKLW